MPRPLVSIIVPAFEAQATIARCLQSLEQTALAPGDLEILVEPDDGGDYSWLQSDRAVMRVAAPGLVGSGPGPTRNRALRRALGEWITYVDADDYVAPGYIDALVACALRDGAALAQTQIAQGDARLLHFGAPGMALAFSDWSRSGISVRVMLHRSAFPEFRDAPAQDIFHIVEATLQRGRPLVFSDAVYLLTLGVDTVTMQPGFSQAVAAAYGQYINHLTKAYPPSDLRAEALAFWRAKLALNQGYLQSGADIPYYEFVSRSA